MVLTPEDVRGKQFATVRFREGYDLKEVDGFLDEVEAELARLMSENDALRAQLVTAQQRLAAAPAAAPTAAPAPPPDPNSQMVRMLELAQRTADQALSDARSEADRIVAEARDVAARDTAAADNARSALERKIDELRAFERDYRARLRAYFEQQLRDLDARAVEAAARGAGPVTGGAAAPGAVSAPQRPAPQPGPPGSAAAPAGAPPAPVVPAAPPAEPATPAPGQHGGETPEGEPGQPNAVPGPSPYRTAFGTPFGDGPEGPPRQS